MLWPYAKKKKPKTTKTLKVMVRVRVLYQLEFVEGLLGEGRRKRAAVILTGGDEAVDQCGDGRYVEGSRLMMLLIFAQISQFWEDLLFS